MEESNQGAREVHPGERKWASAAIAAALTVLTIILATVAGIAATAAYDAALGALEAGARAAGEIEAMTAGRLGAYFAAFQLAGVLLTLLCVPLLRRRVRGPILALGWPRGGVPGIVLAVVALLALAVAAGLLVHRFDKEALSADLRPFAEMARSRGWWVLLMAAGLGAPLTEELLFRGFLFSGLRASPAGFFGAALISALLWTSLHMTYSVYGLALLLVIGLYFAWLRERTGSIVPSMVAHGIYNGLIVVALAFAPQSALA